MCDSHLFPHLTITSLDGCVIQSINLVLLTASPFFEVLFFYYVCAVLMELHPFCDFGVPLTIGCVLVDVAE